MGTVGGGAVLHYNSWLGYKRSDKKKGTTWKLNAKQAQNLLCISESLQEFYEQEELLEISVTM